MLAAIAATVKTLGQNRLKPALSFSPMAQPISSSPARPSHTHAMRSSRIVAEQPIPYRTDPVRQPGPPNPLPLEGERERGKERERERGSVAARESH